MNSVAWFCKYGRNDKILNSCGRFWLKPLWQNYILLVLVTCACTKNLGNKPCSNVYGFLPWRYSLSKKMHLSEGIRK